MIIRHATALFLLVLALVCFGTSVWAEDARPTTMDLDTWYMYLNPGHRELQASIKGFPKAGEERRQFALRINAARNLQALIQQIEFSSPLGAQDFRIGVLLSDLGVAFDTPDTRRQQEIALQAAVRTLAQHVGSERNAPLAFAQAAHRLASFYRTHREKSPAIADTLLPAFMLLKAGREDQAFKSLFASWYWVVREERQFPGIGKVATFVSGVKGGLNPCSGADFSQVLDRAEAAKRSGRKPEADQLALQAVELEVGAASIGCQFRHYEMREGIQTEKMDSDTARLNRLLTQRQRDVRDAQIAEKFLEFKTQFHRSQSQHQRGSVEDALLTLLQYAPPTTASHYLKETADFGHYAGLDSRDGNTHPADLVRLLGEWFVYQRRFSQAEIAFEKIRIFRPSSQGGADGWGATRDVISAAWFHWEYGRRNRATELARLAIGGFPSAQLAPLDRMKGLIVLARNASDEGDVGRAMSLLRPAARIAAENDAKEPMTAVLDVIRSIPSEALALMREDLISDARALVALRLPDSRNFGGDAVPASAHLDFCIEIARIFDAAELISEARSRNPKGLSESIYSDVRQFIGMSPQHASIFASVPPPDNEDKRIAQAGLLLQSGDYLESLKRLDALPVRDRNLGVPCSVLHPEAIRTAANFRLGLGPLPSPVTEQFKRFCAGNSWESVMYAADQETREGVFWLRFGLPEIALPFLEYGLGEFMAGEGQSFVSDKNGNISTYFELHRSVQNLEWLNDLARARFKTGNLKSAYGLIRALTPLAQKRLDFSGPSESRLQEARRLRPIFDSHVALAYASVNKEGELAEDRARTLVEAFDAAQLAQSTKTAATTSRLAARLAANDPKLAASIRKRQDTADRVEQAGREVENAKDDREREAARERLVRARTAFESADRELKSASPKLAREEDNSPKTLAAVRDRLASDEALLVTHTTGDSLFLFFSTKEDARLIKVEATRAQVEEQIRAVRNGLDIAGGTLPRFPFDVSSHLHSLIIAPLLPFLEGKKHISIVADGPFQSLPFAVLGSQGSGASPDYLIKRFSLSFAPSVAAFVDLGASGAGMSHGDSFLGIGDPVLGPPGELRGITSRRMVTRSASERIGKIRELPSLPDTAEELRGVSRFLNGRLENLLLGPDASESKLKSLNLSAHKIISFATHALVAGDLDGVIEPSIVLTPETADQFADGLLTASEIAVLKLDADLVILSACNTAAPDGQPGADGLSGLTRAFLGAGARTLVVSHWRVNSETTTQLMTRFASRLANGGTPAVAMRDAMLAQLASAGSEYQAHPAMWAAFVVVGGRQR